MAQERESFRPYHHNEQTKLVVRLAGLALPVILIAYGFLVRFNVLHISHPFSASIGNWDLYILSILLLVQGLWQSFIEVESNKTGIMIRLLIFHILIGAFYIFISGLASPFIIFWMLLALQDYTYFPKRGLIVNVLSFVIVILFDIFIWQKPDTETVSFGLLTLVIISFISYILIKTSETNEVERSELNIAKTKESLQHEQVVTIINNLADAIISTDMQGIIRVSNISSLRLLDTTASLIGRHVDSVLPLKDKTGQSISVFEELKKTRVTHKRDDLIYSFSNGEKIRLEIIFSPIHNNRNKDGFEDDGYVTILRDITEEKGVEEQREEFISSTSHKLRTPITIAEVALSSAVSMIRNPNVPIAKLESTIDMAHNQVTFLANVINNLNSISTPETNTADNEEIDISEFSRKLFIKYYDEAKNKNLSFGLTLSPRLGKIETNKSYLEEILQNLITNAIKYTTTGSIKMIVKKQKSSIKFIIEDTGIGISRADQAKLFEEVYHSRDYQSQEAEDAGLGLYVSNKLAKKIGSKIQYKSKLNTGSTFWLVLTNKK